MRRFYIDPTKCEASRLTITGRDAHHIMQVLRLTPGNAIELFDGQGRNYSAVIDNIDKKTVAVSITESTNSASESSIPITVGVGMLKQNKIDKLIPPLTELGISELIPFYSSRSVPASRIKGVENRLARWKKIGLESLKQCRRSRIIEIHPPKQFLDVIRIAENHCTKILFWEEQAEKVYKLNADAETKPTSVFLMLGPEGGFESDEIDAAGRSGFSIASLGPRILKAETAVISACTLAQYLFGDMGNNA